MTRNLLFLCLVALTGCTSSPAKPADKAQEGGIKVGAPAKKTLRRVVEQPATVEAFEETALVARIPGEVEKVHVNLGDPVKPGQTLVELKVPELLKELDQKKALVEHARAEATQAAASFKVAEASVLTAQAHVRDAEANYERWKSECKRVEALVAGKVVDQQIRDETIYQCKAAEAKVESAKALKAESEARREKAKADMATAEARIKVMVAEEGRLDALAGYRKIVAPYPGVITRHHFHTGHLLQPQGGTSAIVLQIARTDKLRIIADIPETDAMFVNRDMPVKLQAPVFKAPPIDATVARTSWTLDAKTRTLRIEMDHANDDQHFRPGMFLNLSFTVEFKDRFTLPSTAIFMHNDQPTCWRLVDGKAVRTPLKLGVREGGLVEVLQMRTGDDAWSRVTGNEQVVLSNLGAVQEGKELPTR